MNIRLQIYILVCCSFSLFGQEKSEDFRNQYEFTRFLMHQKLFDFASEELERLHFQYPNDRTILRDLVYSYRQMGDVSTIEKRLMNSSIKDSIINSEFIAALQINDYFQKSYSILTQDQPSNFSKYFQLKTCNELFLQDTKTAVKTWEYSHIKDQELQSILTRSTDLKQKSTFVGAALSSILPGSGRVYAKDAKDGIISLLFVATTAYQSYRRFHANGIKSTSAWIYGGFSLGFYIANIYGTVKSVKRYNSLQWRSIHDDTKNYIRNLDF